MKTLYAILFACVWVLSVQSVDANNQDEEEASIRAEITELRESITTLQARLDQLEQRLAAFEAEQEGLYPWQREQPFYFDGRWPRRPRELRDTSPRPRSRSIPSLEIR